jgi:ParB-like chromosome segregation protein Spo0J
VPPDDLPDLTGSLPDGWTVELDVPLDGLTEHPRNPRRGDVGRIKESIQTYGFADALIVQRATGRIIHGNHRARVARQLGHTRAPVVLWADVDDDTAERILLAYNRASDDSGYDEQSLHQILGDLNESAQGLQGSLYTGEDIATVLQAVQRLQTPFDDLLDPTARHNGSDPVAGGQIDTQPVRQLSFYFMTDDERRDVVARLRVVKEREGLDTDAAALIHVLSTVTSDT